MIYNNTEEAAENTPARAGYDLCVRVTSHCAHTDTGLGVRGEGLRVRDRVMVGG